ncbi:MFS transporter [Gluconacetobacter tumulisoli]|uniref:MFS transporter n=1 Tax=Gluconacetobacter tumulisoli TaxID=1286189 RepID=A0A7W4K9V9_9PROT|nr:glycoside-pentoside-hexuronide (GPH):cation symporter [Gluconacetobacter tumulisoli]MBB2203029.1 hypothetical protein [Gluconacetobacter tumulisoli]
MTIDAPARLEAKGARPRLAERMSFAFGDIVGNGLFGLSGSYLLYFYTNVYGLTAASVAMLMLLVRVVDSVSDPLIGYMIDRRILFGGRVRPYLKWFPLLFGLATFCCFLPLPLGPHGKLAWAYVGNLALGITFSLVIVPYGLLPNVMTRNGQDRLSLAMFRMCGATLGTFIVGACTLPAVQMFGQGNERLGYPITMAVAGLVGGLVAMIPYFTCRERYTLDADQAPLPILLGSLLRNRAWIAVTIVLSLFYINMTAFYGLSIYYAAEVLGRPKMFGGLLISLMGIGKVFGTMASPFLVRRLGPRGTVIAPYVLSMACLALFYISPNRAEPLAALFTLTCFFEGMTLPVFYAMLADSIDFGARITGVRAAGMAYSINSFFGKVAWAMGGALSAALLGWGGYVPQAATQTPTARAFITFGFIGVPMCVACVSILLICLYPSERHLAAVSAPNPLKTDP